MDMYAISLNVLFIIYYYFFVVGSSRSCLGLGLVLLEP